MQEVKLKRKIARAKIFRQISGAGTGASTTRIAAIDGWRAIAAIGVLYSHTWALLNFPHFYVGSVDLMQLLNLWGNGVHLFFVISGFCFFLVLHRMVSIDLKTSLHFLRKRWLRIAPAFYVSCMVYLLFSLTNGDINNKFSGSLIKLAINFCFLQNHVPGTEINAIFWSLAVEWHFYSLLPFIFILIAKIGFSKTIFLIGSVGLVISLLHYSGQILVGFEWWYTIFLNINHFLWGIILGKVYEVGINRLQFFKTKYGFLTGLLTAYIGKIMFSSAFVAIMGPAAFLFQAIGPMLMTCGFSILLYSTLLNKTISGLISCRFLTFVGKVSYSFYLWHSLFLYVIYSFVKSSLPQGVLGVLILMLLVFSCLLPFSFASYKFLELPYFNKRSRE